MINPFNVQTNDGKNTKHSSFASNRFCHIKNVALNTTLYTITPIKRNTYAYITKNQSKHNYFLKVISIIALTEI